MVKQLGKSGMIMMMNTHLFEEEEKMEAKMERDFGSERTNEEYVRLLSMSHEQLAVLVIRLLVADGTLEVNV